MDPDDSDDSSTNSSYLEVAANPLNSPNPPPNNLPSLLNDVIRSSWFIHQEKDQFEDFAKELNSALTDLKRRLENLRAKFPQWRSDNPQRIERQKDKHGLAFGVQEAVYARMVSQISFLDHVARKVLLLKAYSLVRLTLYTLMAFMGNFHNHPGIEVANSDHLHCTDECRWYFDHGPFEWSKKPFTDEWWAEMNHTDWDWVRVREHMDQLVNIKVANQAREIQDFHNTVKEFVPKWFWRWKTYRWGLQSRFHVAESQDGVRKVYMNVYVSYQKTDEEVELEHKQKLAELKKQQEETAVDGEVSPVDEQSIIIEPMGVYNINEHTLFDGELFVVDWEKAEKVSTGKSWLDHWGYNEWLAKKSNASAPK